MKIMSKRLSNTDGRRLALKTSILQYLLPLTEGRKEQDLAMEDEDGIIWRFRLIIRRGRYRKPVLSAGWVSFMKTKRLQRGFKVQIFRELDEAGHFIYKIKLKKPVVIFNTLLGYAPYRAE